MKILIVNTSDMQGGAARAAYRLHRSLLALHVNTQMLVEYKSSDDATVITNGNKNFNIIRSYLDSLHVRFYKNRTKTYFSPAWFGSRNIIDQINALNPDVVHLHWICGGMLKIEDIASIKAPIVWSLHDMWAFTGGCHYDEECKLYRSQCSTCKVLGSTLQNDLSQKVFERKKKTYSCINNMTIVGLSRWLHKCAKESLLLEDKKHVNLPNPIDTTLFKPFDKDLARESWNLPKDKKLVLFGAMEATSDPRKGFEKLSQAITSLTCKEIELVIFGTTEPEKPQNFGFKTHYLGHLGDDKSLAKLYACVNVMVVPSLQENLSNAIMESLACATPVVGFNIGGNSDMIEHKKNGYLVKPFDTKDLKNGIEWVLNATDYNELCVNARETVIREFDSEVVAEKYIELYKNIIDTSK